MICDKCNKDLPENQIQRSHDVPCYLFDAPDRKRKKKQADNYGRHLLCLKCHDIYERILFGYLFSTLTPHQRANLISIAKNFSIKYFKKEDDTTTI